MESFGMEIVIPAFPHLFVPIGAAARAGRSAAALIQLNSLLDRPLPEAVFIRVLPLKGTLLRTVFCDSLMKFYNDSDLDPHVLQSQILSIHSTKDFESLSCKYFLSTLILNIIEAENRVLLPEAKEAAATIEQRLELESKLSDIVKTKPDAHALLDLYKN
ncbi:protein root UVB sensitive 1, chloroplastic [Tanacetum coccineum]